MQGTRTALTTLHTLSRALPSASPSVAHPLSSQRRHASFSLPSLRDLLPRRKQDPTATEEAATPVNTVKEQPKGLFDTVVEEEEVLLSREDQQQRVSKPATFVSNRQL